MNHARIKYEVIEVGNTEVIVDVSMMQKSESMFFNATVIAQQFRKDVRDFLKLDATQEYIALVEHDLSLSGFKCGMTPQLELIVTKRGKHGGTWLHNDLALRFARWCSVSFEYRLDRWVEQRLKGEQQRKLAREAARTGFLPMTQAIQSAHDEPKGYHYSNECNLINKLVLGMTGKKFKAKHGIESVRDGCDVFQIHLIEKLQRINTSLIEVGFDYDTRKGYLVKAAAGSCAIAANDNHGLEVAA